MAPDMITSDTLAHSASSLRVIIGTPGPSCADKTEGGNSPTRGVLAMRHGVAPLLTSGKPLGPVAAAKPLRRPWVGKASGHQEVHMPQGDKSSYTDKQKRKAEHIEEGYVKRGVSKKEAESRAWATVNKE